METCTDFSADSIWCVEGADVVTVVDEFLKGGGLGSPELAEKRGV